MEVRDGFIVSIFNYCDRWCETCAFTSRCRLVADVARMEASLDPAMKAIVEAPPLPQDIPPPPAWLEKLIDEANEAAEKLTPEELARFEPKIAPEHKPIHERGFAYCTRVHRWLRKHQAEAERNPADPVAIIAWFASLNSGKIYRALTGLADDDPADRDWPADFDGSAKVAILGIERSHAAWLRLIEQQRTTADEAAPFIADLVWLGNRVEQVFPNARAFVRPAFDEPEAVAELGKQVGS